VFVLSWVYCHPEQFVPIERPSLKSCDRRAAAGHSLAIRAGSQPLPPWRSRDLSTVWSLLATTGSALGEWSWEGYLVAALAAWLALERPQQIAGRWCLPLFKWQQQGGGFVRTDKYILLSGRLNLESAFWLRWLSDASTRSLLGAGCSQPGGNKRCGANVYSIK